MERTRRAGFVGRATELEQLFAALADLDAGGRVVLLGGDAGIGKSRLVQEFCATACEKGGVVAVSGACVPVEGGLPYAPILAILRDLASRHGASAAGSALDLLVTGATPTEPAEREGSGVAGSLSDALAKTRLFEAILSAVVQVAAAEALVLVVEDLHWTDSATAEVLDFLIRNLDEAPVLILGTYRAEDVGRDHPLRPWITEVRRHPRVTHVQLDGLNRSDVADLIAEIVGEPPSWTVLDAVLARSEGNPFFVEELTAARESPSLPAELHDLVLARVRGLSGDAQRLLGFISAAEGISHELLARLTGLSPVDLNAALVEAIDRQVLVVDPDDSTYDFRHALLREAVYSTMLPGERRRLHRDIAALLAGDPDVGSATQAQRTSDLAAQWWAAGEWAESLVPLVEAADAASGVFAFPEAFVHLERAVTAMDQLAATQLPSGIDRLALLEKAAHVAFMVGENDKAHLLTTAALETIDLTRDPEAGARIYALMNQCAWQIGDSATAFDCAKKAIALLPADVPSYERALVLAEDARGLMITSHYEACESRCHEAIAAARAIGSRRLEGHAMNTLGVARGHLGHIDEGVGLVREALAIAEELTDAADLNRAYKNLSYVLLAAGRLDEAVGLVYDGAAAGEELWGVRLNGAAGNVADALVCGGRYREAEELFATLGKAAVGPCAAAPYRLPAPMAIYQGRFDTADELLQADARLIQQNTDFRQRRDHHVVCAVLDLERDRGREAYGHLEIAQRLSEGFDDASALAEIAALSLRSLADQVGEATRSANAHAINATKQRATQLASDVRAMFDDRERRALLTESRTLAFGAMCAAEHSRIEQSDPELWDEAARCWDTAGEPYPVAYCRWREAEALLESRAGRQRAAESLEQAWQISSRLGLAPMLARIEQLTRRARIVINQQSNADPTGQPAVAQDLGLTPREVEVLGLLAIGRTDREIAEELFISKKTASVHVSNLLRKLDATNRVEAGRIGQAHGLGAA